MDISAHTLKYSRLTEWVQSKVHFVSSFITIFANLTASLLVSWNTYCAALRHKCMHIEQAVCLADSSNVYHPTTEREDGASCLPRQTKTSSGASVCPLLPWWSGIITGEGSHLLRAEHLYARGTLLLCLRCVLLTPLTGGTAAESCASGGLWATQADTDIGRIGAGKFLLWLLHLDQFDVITDGNSIQF